MNSPQLSWKTLKGLEDQYGDSFYLLDQEHFRSNYQEFLAAFQAHYSKTAFAYSYKTNYLPRLCRIAGDLGGYAEVVSGMEYELALQVGIRPEHIIFNGPFKRTDDMTRALMAGSIVNLESPYELEVVESVAQSKPDQAFSVGLRCNFDLPEAAPSRFGFEADGDVLAPVFERLANLKNCRIDGLHCHILTPKKSVTGYEEICDRILALAARFFKEAPPRFIDLGGGFFSRMSDELREQFSFPVPTYSEYGAAIASRFRKAFPDQTGPELILEPGISLTADIMQFVCRVVDIKEIRKQSFAQLTGSIYNIKPTLNEKNLPIEVIRGPGRAWPKEKPLDLAGYTCMEHDLLFRGYEDELGKGDYVLFNNVGAYTIVLKPPFILPSPAILAYGTQPDTFEVLRHPESFKNVFSSYLFDDPSITI